MDLNTRLQNVAVVGAGGKMGSGIVLIVCREMLRLKLLPENRDKQFALRCVDLNESALEGLKKYLQKQLSKGAEKKIAKIKEFYPNISEDEKIIEQYTEDGLSLVSFENSLAGAAGSSIVFEAIFENRDIKIKALTEIKNVCGPDTFFFTNTSSIPIRVLEEGAELTGRIIGYHFYNPTAIQKLLELIPTENTVPELKNEIANDLAARLGKKVIPANDIAGFIGNGHFMRDILHAVSEIDRLSSEHSQPEAIFILNKISKDFLIRPMGIFQLADYVGLDVCQCILKVMDEFIDNEDLSCALIDRMMELGVKGGQFPDGSPKDGFFKYEKGKPVGVFNVDKQEYILYDEENALVSSLKEKVGALPEGSEPWKVLLSDPERSAKLDTYFTNLKSMDTFGADLAKRYLVKIKEIGNELLANGVALTKQDVNATLENGFYHLYGPINNFIA